MDGHIFVDMEYVIDQYDNVHMFLYTYVYKQVLNYRVLDKKIVSILMMMKQYDIELQLHDHTLIVSILDVNNHE